MKISKLLVSGQDGWPDLRIENLDCRMNVFFAPSRAGKSTLVQLVGHLLYGKLAHPSSRNLLPFRTHSQENRAQENRAQENRAQENRARRNQAHEIQPQDRRIDAGAFGPVPGTVQVESETGPYIFRRQYQQNQSCRLTISAVDGGAVSEQTIPSLLAHLPPTLLSRLYVVDFNQSPRTDWLLEESLTRQLQDITENNDPPIANREVHIRCGDQRWGKAAPPVEHEPLDILIDRRDNLARQLAEHLSERHRRSGDQQHELVELETALTDLRGRAEELRSQLRGVETRLTTIEIRLRYFSLERAARQDPWGNRDRSPAGCPPADDIETRHHSSDGLASDGMALAELDAEISRCRPTLRDLETRAATLRSELAQLHPDGTADRVTSLIDGRATLGVLECLADDLDAEIAQLARANQPARCVGHDAHARMAPVAEMIRQQIYTLCGQLAEQQRVVRRQQIEIERRQLARTQTDLGEQLEQLLSRREGLIHASQWARPSAMRYPQAPVPGLCQCEHHGPFLQDADAMILDRTDRASLETDALSKQRHLEEQRNTLQAALDPLAGEIDRLQSRWQLLQRDRATLIDTQSLDSIQAELQQLEKEISLEIDHPQASSTVSGQPRASQPDRVIGPIPLRPETSAATDWKTWRASDILAQLTDGRLVQIRLQRMMHSCPPHPKHANRALILIDREGQPRKADSLTEAEQDQLYLALTLALVAAHAQHGIELPLLLDEPFLRQDQAAAAAMAGLLHQFAHGGQQLLVFTENRHALRQFQSLRSQVHLLDALRHQQQSGPASRSPESNGTSRWSHETPDKTNIASPTSPTASPTPARSPEEKESPGDKKSSSSKKSQRSGKSQPTESGVPERSGKHRFYLEPHCPVEDAPSIGPKTADRLAKVGIRSVADLLHADPESTAAELAMSRIHPGTITAWQQQARLVCRIPQLRGFGAQLLVACELTEPEQLVGDNREEIVAKLMALCQTKQGQRILRGSDAPSRGRIEGWIRNAAHTRSLEAA